MTTLRITIDNKRNATMLRKMLQSMAFVKNVEEDITASRTSIHKAKVDRVLTHLASEKTLAKEWNLPEEDEAWKDL